MHRIARGALAAVGMTLLACDAQAADISGVWATSPTVCAKVFVKDAGTIKFSQSSDSYGSGFIIEGNRIRGKIATCTIKGRRQDGDTIHLVATCATDITLSQTEFSLKMIDPNKVSRLFPGMPELKTDYFRCQM